MRGTRDWAWQCWVIWLVTAFLAGAVISEPPGNPYFAAMLVMGFMHYFHRRNSA